jgi:hypothetical protein
VSIELVKKEIVMDDKSFLPVLEMVIKVPIEAIQDEMVLDPNFYENIGRSFMSLIEAKA